MGFNNIYSTDPEIIVDAVPFGPLTVIDTVAVAGFISAAFELETAKLNDVLPVCTSGIFTAISPETSASPAVEIETE